MKIGIDIDGTITNFEKFILDNSQKYMMDNYGLEIVNSNGYDIDEMYDLENTFLKRGYSEHSAIAEAKKIMDKFWEKYFHLYLMSKLRKDVSKTIKKLYYKENEIIIFSSRKRTTEDSFIGKVVKYSTLAMLKLNGIKTDNILFFENDDDKVEEMKKRRLDLVFEDKPHIIEELSKTTEVVCVDSNYNTDVPEKKNIHHIDDFEPDKIMEIVNGIKEKKGSKKIDIKGKITLYDRAIKFVSKRENDYKSNDISYSLVRNVGGFFLMKKFKPIIINPENAKIDGPAIISPNHRTTIDPFFVLSTTKFTTHWAALKRFFDAEDSIANNRKNPLLTRLTALFFRITGALPIERSSDNPKANNRETIQRMRKLLKDKRHLGIFPEGTTNKNPDKEHIYESDRKGNLSFILLREGEGTSILPVSIHWIKDKNRIKNRVIINYRDPITAEEVEEIAKDKESSFTDVAYDVWKEKVTEGLLENIEIEKKLNEEVEKAGPKVKKKVCYNPNKK